MTTRQLNPGTSQHFHLNGIDFSAFAVAGFASYVAIPNLDLCFDLGFAPIELLGINNIFLSHVHLDHMAGLPMYLAQRHMKAQPLAKVYTPKTSVLDLVAALSGIERMQEGSIPIADVVQAVEPGDKIPLNKTMHMEVFAVDHVLPSVGYSVVESKRKLKDEFLGLPGMELKALRESGVAIDNVVEKRLVTYVGDSTIDTYAPVRDIINTSETLFVEITHLLPNPDRDNSKKYGHTTLPGFLSLLEKDKDIFSNVKTLVLKHFSMRHTETEIVDTIKKSFPADLLERTFLVV